MCSLPPWDLFLWELAAVLVIFDARWPKERRDCRTLPRGMEGYIDCCCRPLTVVRTPVDQQSLYVLRLNEGMDCRTVHVGGEEGKHICAQRLLLD